jgi:hypothetical protein
MSSTCFAVVATGPYYMALAPFFAWSVLWSYPYANVRLYLREPSQWVEDVLSDLCVDASRCIIVDDGLWCDRCPIAQLSTKMLRWTLPLDPALALFDRIYIGDVDIMITREMPTLTEAHDAHAKVIGLPYSNILTQPKRGLPVVTGLQFIQTEPYLEAMRGRMMHARTLIAEGTARVRYSRDRYLLTEMLKIIGLPPLVPKGISPEALDLPPTDPYYRPHHGPHLRAFAKEARAGTRWLTQSKVYQRYSSAWSKMFVGNVREIADRRLPAMPRQHLKAACQGVPA